MRRIPWWPLATVAAAAMVAAGVSKSWASDHRDSAYLTDLDPEGDIAGVYSFMRPGSTSHLVLGMTVQPGATEAVFPYGVEYTFHVNGVVDPAAGVLDPALSVVVTCRFQAPGLDGSQVVSCNGNGVSTAGTVGVVSGSDSVPLRVYAGLRADPEFGDLAAGQVGATGGDAGVNAFAASNVLALIVEADVDRVVFGGASVDADGGPAQRPLLAVSGETVRIP